MNPLTNLRLWWLHRPSRSEARIHKRMDYQDVVMNDILRRMDKLNTFEPALGRIIAKLDPIYGTSDFSEAKRAESDRIGEEAIRRIQAEDKARRHTTGEL